MASSKALSILAKADKMDRLDHKIRKTLRPHIDAATSAYTEARLSGQYDPLVVDQLAKLDYCCPVCTKDLKESAATIDHIEPKSKYFHKATDTSNFLVMCYPCNNAKSDRNFKQWRLRQVKHSRQSIDYAIRLIHGQARLDELLDK